MSPAAHLLRGLVRLYQFTLSPLLGRQCRFLPTCSHYALEALERHGAAKGGWLALRRFLRCHPFATAGYDPVPGSAPAPSAGPMPPAAAGRDPRP
ncbi:MAG: membrane protein insertion efficiency factor YidD [Rhodospirillaceae bacterium]|nr:membrane protein insertion efficiency factor YidD [Rhodospirillaceae bacterium]